MKIGIDISQIVHGGGVSVYTQSLVESLLRVDRKNQYTLFFSSLRKKAQNYHSKLKAFKIPPTALDFLWNRLHVLPIERFVGPVDVFHSSDWTQPPAQKARLVTTIHDLSFLRWPESVHPKALATQKRRLKWVKKEVDQIITPSRASKKEVVALLGIDPERITVIWEGVPKDAENFKVRKERLKAIKEKLGIRQPYIFALGSRAPRKNIKRLTEAFVKIRKKTACQLVISGDYKPEGGLPAGVVLTGFLPRKELLAVFSQAKVFAYPSLYEGFGLPILEAFALGVPVVTGNTSSMAEVAGKAAGVVDPKSTEAVGSEIARIICDVSMHRKLVKRGRERLKLFSWEKAARQTLGVYEKTA